MNIIKRLFGKSDESGEVLCPRCEREMEPGHVCAGLSRRFFLGVSGAAAAALVLPTAALDIGAPDEWIASGESLLGGGFSPDINAIIARLVDQRKDWVYDTLELAPGTVVKERRYRILEEHSWAVLS